MPDARLANRQGQAVALLVGVFLIGVGSGAVGMRAYEHQTHKPGAVNYVYGTDTDAAVDRLEEELGLRPDQIEKVTAILDESIMQEADLLYQVRRIQDQGRRRILDVLDAEQKAKFEDLSRRAAVQ